MNLHWHLNYLSITLALIGFVCLAVGEQNTEVQRPVDYSDQTLDTKQYGGSSKLFGFEQFTSKFKKVYSSFVERITRRRIYLGHVIRVFISAIKYNRRLTSTYLAINQFSDQTADEFRRIMNTKVEVDADESSEFEPEGDGALNLNDASAESVEDLEREIDRILEHQKEEVKKSGEGNDLIKSGQRRNADQQTTSHLDNYLNSVGDVERTIDLNIKEKTEAKSSFASKLINLLPNKIVNLLSGFKCFVPQKDNNLAVKVTKSKVNTRGSSSSSRQETSVDEINIDHRRSGCFFPPRDQGDCASCYAFAAMSFYEWAHCMATGKLIAFSEQYVVDCGAVFGRDNLDGCDGGKFTTVGEFVNLFGLELKDNYPYVEREYGCPYKKNKMSRDKMGFIRIETREWDEFSESEIDKNLKNAPVLINFKTNSQFSEYGGGVDLAAGCRTSNGVHSALIIGDGRQDGEEYWLIRNSFSPSWGEQGYYKLNKRTKCLIPKDGFQLNPQFSEDYEENLNENYDGNEITKRRKQYVEIERELRAKARNGKKKRKFRR